MSQLADEKEHRKSSATLFEQVSVYKEKLRKAKAVSISYDTSARLQLFSTNTFLSTPYRFIRKI